VSCLDSAKRSHPSFISNHINKINTYVSHDVVVKVTGLMFEFVLLFLLSWNKAAQRNAAIKSSSAMSFNFFAVDLTLISLDLRWQKVFDQLFASYIVHKLIVNLQE